MEHYDCRLCQHKDVCRYRDRYVEFTDKINGDKEALNKSIDEIVGVIPHYISVEIVVKCDHYLPILSTAPFVSGSESMVID